MDLLFSTEFKKYKPSFSIYVISLSSEYCENLIEACQEDINPYLSPFQKYESIL